MRGLNRQQGAAPQADHHTTTARRQNKVRTQISDRRRQASILQLQTVTSLHTLGAVLDGDERAARRLALLFRFLRILCFLAVRARDLSVAACPFIATAADVVTRGRLSDVAAPCAEGSPGRSPPPHEGRPCEGLAEAGQAEGSAAAAGPAASAAADAAGIIVPAAGPQPRAEPPNTAEGGAATGGLSAAEAGADAVVAGQAALSGVC